MNREHLNRQLVIITIAVLLTGCSSLSKRLDEAMKEGQALTERCELAADAFPIPAKGSDFADDLIARFKVKVAGLCPGGIANAVCRLLDLEKEFKQISDDAQSLPEPLRKQWVVESGLIDVEVRKLHVAREALGNRFDRFRNDFLKETAAQKLADECRVSVSRHKCAEIVLLEFRKAENGIDEIRKLVAALGVQSRQLHNQIMRSAVVMRAEQQDADVVLRRLFAKLIALGSVIESGAAAGSEAWEIVAGGGTSEMVREYFVAKFTFRAAETTLNALERAVSRFDRMIDKIDDKTYAVSAFVMWTIEDDIQRHIDRFYIENVRRHFKNPVTTLAFARAACERLMVPMTATQRPSLVMPFLLQAFTNIDIESDRQNKCIASGGEGCDRQGLEGMLVARSDNFTPEVGEERRRRLETVAGDDTNAYAKVATLAYTTQTAKSAQKTEPNDIETTRQHHARLEQTGHDDLKLQKRRSMALVQEKAHDKATAPGDLENLVIRTSAEWSVRRQMAMARAPIDEARVRELGAVAGGEAIYAYHEICATVPCVAGERLQGMAQALPVIVNTQINLGLQQYLTTVVPVRNEINIPAPPLPLPVQSDPICADLTKSNPSLRCITTVNGSLNLRIDHSFSSGQWQAESVRRVLRDVAEYFSAREVSIDALVKGYTSVAEWRCSRFTNQAQDYLRQHAPKVVEGLRCVDATDGPAADQGALKRGNYFLSALRAAWAAQELRGHGNGFITIQAIDPAGATRAAPGNAASDRQLVLVLKRQSNARTARMQ
ncbi:MAG: hypothetical protein ACO1PN_06805 [Betaproteobacteria bacterium]